MQTIKNLHSLPKVKSLALAILLLGSTAANAAVVFGTSVGAPIYDLTTSATTGADMNGMTVYAQFANGDSQTLTWANSGTTSGGVNGASWSLSLTGDSFMKSWAFTNNKGSNLVALQMDGASKVVFDTTFNGLVGTPNSDSGKTFNANTSLAYVATYSNLVGTMGNAPVGDIYQTLSVNFSGAGGIGGNWIFNQDTDNVSVVPVPAAAWLFGSGLLGLAGFARKSSLVSF